MTEKNKRMERMRKIMQWLWCNNGGWGTDVGYLLFTMKSMTPLHHIATITL